MGLNSLIFRFILSIFIGTCIYTVLRILFGESYIGGYIAGIIVLLVNAIIFTQKYE